MGVGHDVDEAVAVTGILVVVVTVSVRVEVTGGSVTMSVAVPQIVVVETGSMITGAVGVGRFVSSEKLQAVGVQSMT